VASITVRQLLDHTGGWSRETGCTGCASQGDPMFETQTIAKAQGEPGPPGCSRVIQYMLSQPVAWAPGQVYDYSNLGYCILGAVIEKVTGSSYSDWVTRNVLANAGASGIVQGQTLWPTDREVVYYDTPGATPVAGVFTPDLNAATAPYGGFYLEAMAAHGAWVASPVDLLRFQGAIDGITGVTPLLSPLSLAQMTQNPNVPWAVVDASNRMVLEDHSGPGTWYGLGWSVNSAGNWWHLGSLPGTASEQVHTSDGWGWTAFFNERPQDPNFQNEIDAAMWDAKRAASDWLTTDLFDQYGIYTDWMNASDYQDFFNRQTAGLYPSRVEAMNVAGSPLYRAFFAPFHGSGWETHHGLSCSQYQSLASSLATQGYQPASLQSYVSGDGTRRYQATWVQW
jgi:hypothetical protein